MSQDSEGPVHKPLSSGQASFLTITSWSHPELLSTHREALRTSEVPLACHHSAPQEAGMRERCSLLAPPFLGKASMVRGPFLQGTVNGYYS